MWKSLRHYKPIYFAVQSTGKMGSFNFWIMHTLFTFSTLLFVQVMGKRWLSVFEDLSDITFALKIEQVSISGSLLALVRQYHNTESCCCSFPHINLVRPADEKHDGLPSGKLKIFISQCLDS